jgi:hypothetical protein
MRNVMRSASALSVVRGCSLGTARYPSTIFVGTTGIEPATPTVSR